MEIKFYSVMTFTYLNLPINGHFPKFVSGRWNSHAAINLTFYRHAYANIYHICSLYAIVMAIGDSEHVIFPNS